MRPPQNPAEKLLCELRRQAGDSPDRVRFKPMEWASISRSLGLTDPELQQAVYSLRRRGYIEFTPATTEIIGITVMGIEAANQQIKLMTSPRVEDQIPDTLEGVRQDMAYWEQRQFEGDPGSNWWEQVDARLRSLRQRENRFMAQSPTSIHNTLVGPNARVNIGSTDQSINVVNVTTEELFTELRRRIEAENFDVERKQGILKKVQELEAAKDTAKWPERYSQFISTVADHWTVLQPILSALLSKLAGG